MSKPVLVEDFDSIALSRKNLMIIVLIISSLFYFSICLGIQLGKMTYVVSDFLNQENIPKMVKFRKDFNFKSTRKFIFNFFVNYFRNWLFRIVEKAHLIILMAPKAIQALYNFSIIFRRRLRRIRKGNLSWKRLFSGLKKLLSPCLDLFQIYLDFLQEILFFHNLRNFWNSVGKILFFLLTNSILIAEWLSLFYLLVLFSLGLGFGFFYAINRKEDEIYMFVLLFWFKLIHEKELINNLDLIQNEFKPFRLPSLQPRNIFSEIVHPTLRLPVLSQEFNRDAKSKIPLPIIMNPLILLELDSIWNESPKYRIELYKYCKKIKKNS